MPNSRQAGTLALVAFLLFSAAPAAAAPPVANWSAPVLIETDNAGNAREPQVALDASGNAVAVWRMFDGTRDNIWANRYIAGSGWGNATLIETDNAGNAASPQLAIDIGGNATAVWRQSDGARDNIWANRFLPGQGWGIATLLENDSAGNAFSPQVAAEPAGNAIAVWHQNDGARDNVWAARFVAGTGWENSTLLETDNAGNAREPSVAIDPAGNAVAVWRQWDGARDSIYASLFIPGSGWNLPALIEFNNTGNAQTPKVAVDSQGAAVAVWRQSDGTRDNIWANRFVPGSGWGAAGLIETDNAGNALDPQVAVDAAGNAVAVWRQSDGTRDNIWASRYVAGQGWGNATLLETDNVANALGPDVVLDSGGNATAVWYQGDGARDNIWASRFEPTTGWANPLLLETDNVGNARAPQIAGDPAGDMVAVWRQADGTRDSVFASRYTAPDVTPPPLQLTEPLDGTATDQPTVWVAGTTRPGVALSVNGVLASLSANGSFGLLIALSLGPNTITVTATNAWGNAATASVIVTFNDPLPALLQQLADAQAAFNDSQANLSAVQWQLAAAEANLSAATSQGQYLEAALAAAEANLSAARTQIASLEATAASLLSALNLANASVSTAQARAAALEADQNTTMADLAAARAALASAEARAASLEAALAQAEADLAAARAELDATQAFLSEQSARLSAANESLAESQARSQREADSAARANTLGLIGILIGVIGVAFGLIAFSRARKAARESEEEPLRKPSHDPHDPKA